MKIHYNKTIENKLIRKQNAAEKAVFRRQNAPKNKTK